MLTDKDLEELRQERHDDYVAEACRARETEARQERETPNPSPNLRAA